MGPGRVQGMGIFVVKGGLPEHAHLWASGQSGGSPWVIKIKAIYWCIKHVNSQIHLCVHMI